MNKNILTMVLITVLMFTGVAGALFSQEAIGKVVSLQGSVEAKLDEDGAWRALSKKSDVYEKDTIKTGEDSKVVLFFIDETNVSIGPETTIKIEKLIYSPAQNHREGKMNVVMGKARFNVGKLFSKDSSFEVRTPTAVAGVKGTSFIVNVTSEQLTQLLGLSGVVTVTSISPEIGGEMLLTSGFIISVEDGAPPGDPIPISFDELLDFLQNLGLINGGDDGGGGGTGNVGGNNFGDLRPGGGTGGGQGIINQPLGGNPPAGGPLPEPPEPPYEPPNGIED
ncbi:MAG: FecR family protein [Candidatus Omnitrophica bacterium]|nr:FecR family protein [Candidatus Omnitrophota bacterium]MBU1048119.1 FecR family protein [Candidatus Omnitrophota bacterium]MBU1630476.1 FecR family protein [Candidatus Omnitrophota bacterium]MBU1766876.1 FecR family protein [Candidatus Omnitrophota bacterium]MBU1889209.1 FecR family protein [Candidatus Omnitrophota bacterium]